MVCKSAVSPAPPGFLHLHNFDPTPSSPKTFPYHVSYQSRKREVERKGSISIKQKASPRAVCV